MKRMRFVLLVGLVSWGCAPFPAPDLSISLPLSSPWQERKEGLLAPPAPEFLVPPGILYRLIQSESSWNPRAAHRSSREYSLGLAQVNMRYLEYFTKKYGLTDPLDPYQAVLFVERYLYDLYLQTGSWEEAVLAYKFGLDNRHRVGERYKHLAHWIVYGGEK